MGHRNKMLVASIGFTGLTIVTFWWGMLPIDEAHQLTAEYQTYEHSRLSYYIEHGTPKELAIVSATFVTGAMALITLHSSLFSKAN